MHRVGQPFGSIILALVVTVGPHLVIGLEAEQIVLLLLSQFVAIVSVTTGRTTSLQGGIHLINFGAFMTPSAVP